MAVRILIFYVGVVLYFVVNNDSLYISRAWFQTLRYSMFLPFQVSIEAITGAKVCSLYALTMDLKQTRQQLTAWMAG